MRAKNLILAAALFAATSACVSGCSALSPAVNLAEQKAATAVVESSERVICRDIPVGTWQRMYGNSSERADGWRALCSTSAELPTLLESRVPK